MARQDVNRDDVLEAIAEFDDLGQDLFLAKYGMGKATAYLLPPALAESENIETLSEVIGIDLVDPKSELAASEE